MDIIHNIVNFKHWLNRKHFSSAQIIVIGFLCAISIGCLLLMLPISTVDGKGASFLDALFTATSSTCVTGLVVQNTATYWSMFGQLIILLLIQVGGMGVITVAVAIAIFSGKKIGLMQRSTMQEAIAAPNMKGIVRFTSFIIKVALTSEIIGAIVMAFVFCDQFGFLKGCWYAIFHSVSAFCNAGFDLMGMKAPFCSLMDYQGQTIINAMILFLIVWGGIGFLTWEDLYTHKWHFRKYRMQSKVILTTSFILIILPTIYFYFIEFSNEIWVGMSEKEKVLSSMFQSITPRTAGFNTVDLVKMTSVSQFVMIILMLIGGSPGSTAGGMKTTTVAVLIASMLSVFGRDEDMHIFGRRIATGVLRNAAAILMLYLCLFLIGGMLISLIEGLPLLDCLFESASAIGTVGLSLGLTPQLGSISRIILICLMYLGRVGGLTLVFAATSNHKLKQSRYPQERITVG